MLGFYLYRKLDVIVTSGVYAAVGEQVYRAPGILHVEPLSVELPLDILGFLRGVGDPHLFLVALSAKDIRDDTVRLELLRCYVIDIERVKC